MYFSFPRTSGDSTESSLSTFTFPSTTMTFIRPLINHHLCFSTLIFAGNKSTGGSKLVETTAIRPMNPTARDRRILAAIATVTRATIVTKSAAMMRAKRRAVTTKSTPLYSSTERERPQSQARVPRVPARDPMIPARDPRVGTIRIRAHRSLRAGQSHPQIQMITGIMSKLQVRGPSIPLPMNHSAWRSMATMIF